MIRNKGASEATQLGKCGVHFTYLVIESGKPV